MYFLLTNLLGFTRILNLKAAPQKKKKKKWNKKRKKQSRGSFPEPESANVATYKEEASWELIQIETAYFDLILLKPQFWGIHSEIPILKIILHAQLLVRYH